jgi:GNAT superfamily N-acetyltransferase
MVVVQISVVRPDLCMLKRLELKDMDEAATVHRMAFNSALPHLANFHSPEEDRWFFRERMFRACQLWGYYNESEMAGMIAFREGWIDQLYVRPIAQSRGLGTVLLQVAKTSFDRLNLWTFQCNEGARRFYEARGFKLVTKTDGTRNEEKEPDALYLWVRP